MLKSTHKTPEQRLAEESKHLPPNWTAHLTAAGQVYYYNSLLQQYSYARPSLETFLNQAYAIAAQGVSGHGQDSPQNHSRSSYGFDHTTLTQPPKREHKPQPQDRPKRQYEIPDCAPWILVTTRLKRRFVHNKETGESLWKFPQDVLEAVTRFDIERHRAKALGNNDSVAKNYASTKASEEAKQVANESKIPDEENGEESEYEEVEVTDDEEDSEQENHRMSRDQNAMEFSEQDIAWQLAQMDEMDEMAEDEELEEDVEGPEITDEEAVFSFRELLDDFQINPYTTWEKILEEGQIFNDERYTLLPTTKARRDTFVQWSADRIESIKQRREREQKQDPRTKYLRFLELHATPKLFWPEFKRKFKNETEMKSTKLNDKDREKLYRQHITRVSKLSEDNRISDLVKLLETIRPSSSWNSDVSVESDLPEVLTNDVKFISLKPAVRDRIIQKHIDDLPSVDEIGGIAEDTAGRREQQAEALRRREAQVRAKKDLAQREINAERRRLEARAKEEDDARHFGKEGFFAQLRDIDTQND